MRMFFFFVFILVFTGCARKLAQQSVSVKSDSVHVRERVIPKDTILKRSREASSVAVSVNDSRIPVLKSSGHSSVMVHTINDTIYASGICDSVEIKFRYYEREIETFRKTFDSVINKETYIKFKVPDSIKWFAIFGFLVVVLAVIYIIHLLKK